MAKVQNCTETLPKTLNIWTLHFLFLLQHYYYQKIPIYMSHFSHKKALSHDTVYM